MDDNSVSFSPLAGAHTKFVVLGPPGALKHRVVHSVRSLKHFEHVDATSGQPERRLADLRHWFFGRKPSRGFLLEGFPATTAESVVFDAWLEARDETLTACLFLDLSEAAALCQAESRRVCPEDGFVAYAEAGETVPCPLCGGATISDADRAGDAVRAWYDRDAQAVESVCGFFASRAQLFRFDAESTPFATVAGTAQAIAADR